MNQYDASKKQNDYLNNVKKPMTISKQTKLPIKTTTTTTTNKKPQKSSYIIPSQQTLNPKKNFENNDHRPNQLQNNADFIERNEKPKVQVQE
jgi:hypothetical protein